MPKWLEKICEYNVSLLSSKRQTKRTLIIDHEVIIDVR